MKKIYLNSTSPRRKLLLEQMGIEFEQIHHPISEHINAGENALDYVVRMSKEKAKAGFEGKGLTIAADTIVCMGDRVFGKPKSFGEAKEALGVLSGCEHVVLTAVAVFDGKKLEHVISENKVQIKKLSSQEIEDYCKTGEPLDKAGSYGIQGIGGIFVHHIKGSYSGIVGLPIFETEQLLSRFKIDTWSGRTGS